MKKKLKLEALEVKSFVTQLNEDASKIAGGKLRKPEIPTFEKCSQVDACLTAAFTFRTNCDICN